MESFLVPFVTVGLAEIGDKTQLATSSTTVGSLAGFCFERWLSDNPRGLVSRIIPL